MLRCAQDRTPGLFNPLISEVAEAVLVFRDVSERRRAERATDEARAYAEGIVEAVRTPSSYSGGCSRQPRTES